jgi:hypothetical protein
MTTQRDIDYSALHGLFAEQIIREMGGEKARAVFVDLVRQGATKAGVLAEFRRTLPNWTGTADRLAIVYDYLSAGGEGE